MFFRPKPKYEIGDLVIGTDPELQKKRYIIIHLRRWICPNGHQTKRWVYDGPVIEANGGEIKVVTYISTVSEGNIVLAQRP